MDDGRTDAASHNAELMGPGEHASLAQAPSAIQAAVVGANILRKPPAGKSAIISVDAAKPIIFEFDPLDVPSQKAGDSVVFVFPDGAELTVRGLPMAEGGAAATPVTLVDASVITLADLVSALGAAAVEPAAGAQAGSVGPANTGAGFTPYDPGEIGDGLRQVGPLGFGELAFSVPDLTPDEDEIIVSEEPVPLSTPGNLPPDAVDDSAAIGEDDEGVTLTVTDNDSDPDHDVSSLAVTGAPDGDPGDGTFVLNGASIEFQPGTAFQYLDDGEQAIVTYTYTLTDPDGASDTATVTVTVHGANDAPDAVDDFFVFGESESWLGNILANDQDVDEEPLSLAGAGLFGLEDLGVSVDLAVTQAGSFDLDPASLFEFLDDGEIWTRAFTYTVTDGDASATAVATITVVGENDAPDAANDAYVFGENENWSGNVLDNDQDVDEETLTVSAPAQVTLDNLGASVDLTVNTDGSFVLDPGTTFEFLGVGETWTDSFTYTVTDGDATATALATISVVGEADGPNAVDDNATVSEDGPPITIVVKSNDSDPDDPIDSLTVSIAADGDPSDGTFAQSGNDVTFDPGQAFQGLDDGEQAAVSYTYTLADPDGNTDVATISVTVAGANDAPDAADDLYVFGENESWSGNVLDNDQDVDEELLTVSAPAQVTLENFGASVDLSVASDGSFVLDPGTTFEFLGTGETWVDSFTYTVTDGDASATALATITVTGVNDGPVAPDVKAVWMPDDPAQQSPEYNNGYPLLLAAPTDVDGDTLTITVDGVPANGQLGYIDGLNFVQVTAGSILTVEQFTSLIYRPNAVDGADNGTFDYTVSDGTASASSSVELHTVTGDPPFTQTISVGDGNNPLTSGNLQTGSMVIGAPVAELDDFGDATLTLRTDFQQSPFTVPIPGGEQVMAARENQVSVFLRIDGVYFIAVDDNDFDDVSKSQSGFTVTLDDTGDLTGQNWTFDPVTGLMSMTLDFDNIMMLTDTGVVTSTSLAEYLATSGNEPLAGDIWNLIYFDDSGGNEQARSLTGTFNFNNTPDGNITVVGGALSDLIYGGGGEDTLSGNDGDDVIIGRGDGDLLSGGAGADTFVYQNVGTDVALEAGDVISDFDGADILDLSGLVAGLAASPEDAVSGGYVSFQQDGADVNVVVDSNGAAAGGTVATLVTINNVLATDVETQTTFG